MSSTRLACSSGDSCRVGPGFERDRSAGGLCRAGTTCVVGFLVVTWLQRISSVALDGVLFRHLAMRAYARPVATPRWSYIVWFTLRVGSTRLTLASEDSRGAGRPREWREAESTDALLARH